MNKVAIAFLTKDRVELSRRSIKPLLNQPFDLYVIDGSVTPAGKEFARAHSPCLEAYGGADPAVAFALTTLLKQPYEYVGIVENDVLLAPGWFEPTMALFDTPDLTVGAVSARCYEDRVLIQRDGYAVMHNLGWGMQIMTCHAARLALKHMRTSWTTENRRVFAQLSGLDIGAWWAFGAGEHWLVPDWGNDRVLAAHGLASLALTPSPCAMIGQVPPLAEQGLVIAEGPVEARRDDEAFDRYKAALSLCNFGPAHNGARYRDDGGNTIIFAHQVFDLEGAAYKGDWRLKWSPGFGGFAWQAGAAGATLEVMLSGPASFMVSGGGSETQVLIEDLKSGFRIKPMLPPKSEHPLSLQAPCQVSYRTLRLTALSPGLIFYGLCCKEPQPMIYNFPFDWSRLPPAEKA